MFKKIYILFVVFPQQYPWENFTDINIITFFLNKNRAVCRLEKCEKRFSTLSREWFSKKCKSAVLHLLVNEINTGVMHENNARKVVSLKYIFPPTINILLHNILFQLIVRPT